ncbi:hypothetical protein BGX33_001993 [Mortierella sp. NVP41]|nr:hypothetical protein BGX33_001993 [Mortierella sp. NVP41]
MICVYQGHRARLLEPLPTRVFAKPNRHGKRTIFDLRRHDVIEAEGLMNIRPYMNEDGCARIEFTLQIRKPWKFIPRLDDHHHDDPDHSLRVSADEFDRIIALFKARPAPVWLVKGGSNDICVKLEPTSEAQQTQDSDGGQKSSEGSTKQSTSSASVAPATSVSVAPTTSATLTATVKPTASSNAAKRAREPERDHHHESRTDKKRLHLSSDKTNSLGNGGEEDSRNRRARINEHRARMIELWSLAKAKANSREAPTTRKGPISAESHPRPRIHRPMAVAARFFAGSVEDVDGAVSDVVIWEKVLHSGGGESRVRYLN